MFNLHSAYGKTSQNSISWGGLSSEHLRQHVVSSFLEDEDHRLAQQKLTSSLGRQQLCLYNTYMFMRNHLLILVAPPHCQPDWEWGKRIVQELAGYLSKGKEARNGPEKPISGESFCEQGGGGGVDCRPILEPAVIRMRRREVACQKGLPSSTAVFHH